MNINERFISYKDIIKKEKERLTDALIMSIKEFTIKELGTNIDKANVYVVTDDDEFLTDDNYVLRLFIENEEYNIEVSTSLWIGKDKSDDIESDIQQTIFSFYDEYNEHIEKKFNESLIIY